VGQEEHLRTKGVGELDCGDVEGGCRGVEGDVAEQKKMENLDSKLMLLRNKWTWKRTRIAKWLIRQQLNWATFKTYYYQHVTAEQAQDCEKLNKVAWKN